MNPYKVLGVSENASQEEIRKAYLDLVKKYHPDRYADGPMKDLANEKLKEINQAYELLTKKKEYSGYGSSAPHGATRAMGRAPTARAATGRAREATPGITPGSSPGCGAISPKTT